MGRTLVQLISQADDMQLELALDRADAPEIGEDAGIVAGVGDAGVRVKSLAEADLASVDVLVDFTRADVTPQLAETCAKVGTGMVIGTTGMNELEMRSIQRAADSIAIVLSPNMSVGVNVTYKLIELATHALKGFDIDVVETHHRYKVDAPSGTAVRMGEVIAAARGQDLSEVAVYGTEEIDTQRNVNNIGFHSVRTGDVVGEHSVVFGGDGERVEITHKAQSRLNFGAGAVQSIRFVAEKQSEGKTGLFGMDDVLGL